jgi:NadR type nicotinamide-nucleotide adenylyltransferase
MYKIAITGPESSGKTSLTIALAEAFNCPFVEEYSREYLSLTNGKYEQTDLIEILDGQLKMEAEGMDDSYSYLFCDTDALNIWIWSKVKFGKVDKKIDVAWKNHRYDLYLLVYPDIPWEYDSLRESEKGRKDLFNMYYIMLSASKHPFVVIKGDRKQRLLKAIEAINKLSE